MSSGNYNPDTLAIRWETPYQQAHEWAHVEQQFRRTWAWRLRECWTGIPFFERVANLAVEWEASRIAKREMKACGIWTDDDATEAFIGVLSYVLSLPSERLLRKILPSIVESQIAPIETRNIETKTYI